MNRSKFHSALWMCWFAALLGLLLIDPVKAYDFEQVNPTASATPGGPAPFIKNIFEGEPAINVRTGPSTIFYPNPCGLLAFGATARALGSSPAHEWIEIEFADCPNGTGWIYAPNVELSPGYLPIVEPPPTATLLATGTIDPTLAAAFDVQPTETRLPTFTPAPPIVVPSFPVPDEPSANFPMGSLILVIGLMGVAILVVSSFGRR